MPLSLLDRLFAQAPRPLRVEWLSRHEYAHRGLHGDTVAENSPAAFRRAIDAGMGIECDVQRTGDRRVAVFHDWDLDRLTGESGPVEGRSIEDLGKLRLSIGGEAILSLEAMLEQVAGRVPVLIEVKSKRERRIVTPCLAVRHALEGYRGKVAVMSFDPRVPRWFADHAPHIVRGLVVTEEGARTVTAGLKRHASLWHARPDFLAYDVRDLPSRFARRQQARGLPLLSWTVNSPQKRERALAEGAIPIAEGEGVA